MDNQEYLNQISAHAAPTAKKGWLRSSSNSRFIMVGIIGVSLFALIMIIGLIVNSGKGGEKKYATQLVQHIDNTTELIDEYQPNVKSSTLRSYSASLKSVLTNIGSNVSSLLTEKYNLKNKGYDKKIVDALQVERDALNADLFEAKINGNLDRIYTHKMAYEISIFMSEEMQLSNSSKDEDLKEKLKTSYDSLENLYNEFSNFSETK